MSNDLRPPLDDLLATVPSYVVPDARAAWAAGARRRARRRVGGLVLVLVVLAGAGLGLLPRGGPVDPAGEPREGVTGYPTRVEQPWWARDLPDAPGPLAGLVQSSRDRGWFAFTATGRTWALPRVSTRGDHHPTLSPDGTVLAYLREVTGTQAEFVLRDLVTGEEQVFPQLGSGAGPDPAPYFVSAQTPSFWSPDGTRVLVYAGPVGADDQDGSTWAALGLDGSFERVPSPAGDTVWPAGWASDDEVTFVRWTSREGRGRGAALVTTTVSGAPVRDRVLAVPDGLRGLSQWSQSVSPDGSRIALVTYLTGDADSTVTTFATATGELLGTRTVADPAVTCQPSWREDRLELPRRTGHVMAGSERDPVALADPAFGDVCPVWARDALTGERNRGLSGLLLGTSEGWLAWHARAVVTGVGLAAGLLGALLGALIVVRRARRRRLSASAAPGSG